MQTNVTKKATYFFVVRAVGRIISDWSVGKIIIIIIIIIILNLQFAYEGDHIFTL